MVDIFNLREDNMAIVDEIRRLKQVLRTAIKERRKRFLAACAYSRIAEDGFDVPSLAADFGLSAEHASALDAALDHFAAASEAVMNLQEELVSLLDARAGLAKTEPL